MKALVMSDTHNNYDKMLKILQAEKDCGLIIHAGDMLYDIENLRHDFPMYNYEYVIGNNDFTLTVPTIRLFNIENKNIMLTHGHKFGVKRSINNLYYKACENEADICIFGHTHIRCLEKTNGMYILNPGCGAFGEYAVINIENDEIDIKLKSI